MIAEPRYLLTEGPEGIMIVPISEQAIALLIAEVRGVMQEYDAASILRHMTYYAILADNNLSHPTDAPELQEAFDFMVYLCNRLSKIEHGKATWLRWGLGAKGQIEVVR